MSDIASKVKAIIVDKLGVDENEVTPEASFTNDLGADSLDTVELIMEFEKEFDIAIRQVPSQVAGPVQALSRLRVRYKSSFGLYLVLPVAARQANAADVEVPGVAGIDQDRVEFRPVGGSIFSASGPFEIHAMVVESGDALPRVAAVGRAEQGGVLDAGVAGQDAEESRARCAGLPERSAEPATRPRGAESDAGGPGDTAPGSCPAAGAP